MRDRIILDFFHELNKKHPYAILHHIDNIFNKTDDIDLIVNCRKTEIKKFITGYCKQNNYNFVYNTIGLGAIRFNIILYDEFKFIKIELDITYSKNNLFKINVENLLKKRVEMKGINVYKLNNFDEWSFYIMKKAFKRQDFNSHLEYLKTLSPKLTNKQIKLEYNKKRDYFKSFGFNFKYGIQKGILFFIRIVETPSLIIGFLGPDGSGKSTVIEGVKKDNPWINFKYFHLKPTVKRQDFSNAQKIDNPHYKKPYSYFISIFKIVYFIFQYNIAWIINIIPIKHTPTLIVFDRYFDDIIADPKRYRYNGPINFVKFAKWLIPKPAIIYILCAPTSVIHSRKKEVSLSELEAQLDRYKKLHKANNNYLLIDVNRPVNCIIKEVVLDILKNKNDN